MLLNHQSILKCIDSNVIDGGRKENAGPVSYDLTTQSFFRGRQSYSQALTSYTLNPGDSVFVSAAESIKLPRRPGMPSPHQKLAPAAGTHP